MILEVDLQDGVSSNPVTGKSSSDDEDSSKFPVAAVAVSITLCVLSLLLLVLLCTIRKRRKTSKYKEYSQVAKESIKPPQFPVKPGQHVVSQQVKPRGQLQRDTLQIPQKMSSEESLAPLSSDDTYYDAEDNNEGRRSPSLSSREPSPSRAAAEDNTQYPLDHIGRIWFTVQYDQKKENLKVVLNKARNLPYRSDPVIKCNPLLKISLLPQDKQIGQSRYKRKNTNPVYNEQFYVPLPSNQVERTTLCLTVIDWYRANQQKQIGHVMYPLKEMDLNVENELEKDLTTHKEESADLGNVHISLSYYPTLHRLTIIVLRATGLKRQSQRDTETFVKVSFSIGNKIMKTKRTAVHKETVSPMFNEAFNFTVTEEDLTSSTLLVSVMYSGGAAMEDKLIGRILLGGRMYARGRECDHWMEMMSNFRKMVKCWHELHA